MPPNQTANPQHTLQKQARLRPKCEKRGIAMKREVERRVRAAAEYVLKTGATVRACAAKLAVGKTTVHKDLRVRLPELDRSLAAAVGKGARPKPRGTPPARRQRDEREVQEKARSESARLKIERADKNLRASAGTGSLACRGGRKGARPKPRGTSPARRQRDEREIQEKARSESARLKIERADKNLRASAGTGSLACRGGRKGARSKPRGTPPARRQRDEREIQEKAQSGDEIRRSGAFPRICL